MNPRLHTTKSGRFGVRRWLTGLEPVHVQSDLRAGCFSHLTIKTIRQAIAGLELVEASLSAEQLAALDGPRDIARDRGALLALIAAFREHFPNGGWAP